MTTVLSIMDRGEWGANTDNIVVVDPKARTLLWVPRDLWFERFGNRIARVFAYEKHQGLMEALAENGIAVDHSLCVRREAIEAALADVSITVPVTERLEFWYPREPTRPIEEGRKLIAFEPPEETLAGERIHQWAGARYERDPYEPRGGLLFVADYARMRRQQVLVRRLLEDGFDFSSVLDDQELFTASATDAIAELSAVDRSWRLTLFEEVRDVVRNGNSVLERSDRTDEPARNGDQPTISVVVCSYRSRHRIDHALGSLRRQDLDEPWEVIVVDSGDDDAVDYVRATYPEARVVRSPTRLYPAAARNAGVRAARGRFVAFVPDDAIAEPDWLRRRLQRHREGLQAVGGAITNGTPWHPVGTACYFTEYTALLPSERILRQQEIPHSLSYERALLDELGGFPEEFETGEDTHLNARLLEQEVSVTLDPQIRLAHVNLTSLRAYLRHLYEHGYGFGYGFELAEGRYGPPAEMSRLTPAWAAFRILVRYPLGRWWASLGRIAMGRARSLPAFLALTPLIWAGFSAAAIGRWVGWRARVTRGAPLPAAPRG